MPVKNVGDREGHLYLRLTLKTLVGKGPLVVHWTEQARNEFVDTVDPLVHSPIQSRVQRRYERGEGGGVT